ncbi:hypothetical protein BB559_006074 [Furculomyces boomerangus]|uniref:Uncharacterized protein n=1 Tax=Furculomyces boomerangus TaxID=61424 RepID=A0A2T9Y4X3_9FUNG|nr:hypothetical protein BB559_006074 [Furculomyces boomerangus]
MDNVIGYSQSIGIRTTSPKTIISDFVIAIINANWNALPSANPITCSKHESPITVYPIGRSEIKSRVHSLISLAFVPTNDVEMAFDQLIEELPEQLTDLGKCFEINTKVINSKEGEKPISRKDTILIRGINMKLY